MQSNQSKNSKPIDFYSDIIYDAESAIETFDNEIKSTSREYAIASSEEHRQHCRDSIKMLQEMIEENKRDIIYYKESRRMLIEKELHDARLEK